MKSFDKNLFVALIFGLFGISIFPAYSSVSKEEFDTIIKKVQENSQRTYEEINSARFEGYMKSYVYVGIDAFDLKMVPFLEESYFDGYWQKPDSLNIIVKALRQVTPDSSKDKLSDLGPLPNPFQFMYDPSVLGMQKDGKKDKIWPLYPFSLKADSVYNYTFISEVGSDENRVLTVYVEPKRSNVPAVVGTYRIDKNRCEVVNSDVVFNDAASFTKADVNRNKNSLNLSVSGTEGHQIKTQKTLMYGQYWLPTEVEEEFELHILGFKVKIQRIVNFEAYFINPEEPDTTLKFTKKVLYARDQKLEEEVFEPAPYPNRLTKKEQDLLIRHIEDKFSSSELFGELIESDNLAQEAFKIGVQQKVGRYVQLSERLGNIFNYNRVEGLKVTHGYSFSNLLFKNSVVSFLGGYGIKDKRLKGEVGFLKYLDNNQKRWFLETNIYHKMDFNEDPRLISSGKNTITSFIYKGDYRDYFYKIGGNVGLGFRATDNLALKLAYVSQTEESAISHSQFSIFKYGDRFRLNPEIAEGEFRGLQTSLLLRSYYFDGKITAEYTDRNYLASDFSFKRVQVDLGKQFRPTYHSKFFLNLSAGAADGYLPPQRWFDFGGRTFMNYHGNLRGVDYKEFTGDRMATAVGEYALNGLFLRDHGIKLKLLYALKFTLWGGLGWSDLSQKSLSMARGLNVPTQTTDDIYYEAGFGISDMLNIFRVDFITNNQNDKKVFVRYNFLQ